MALACRGLPASTRRPKVERRHRCESRGCPKPSACPCSGCSATRCATCSAISRGLARIAWPYYALAAVSAVLGFALTGGSVVAEAAAAVLGPGTASILTALAVLACTVKWQRHVVLAEPLAGIAPLNGRVLRYCLWSVADQPALRPARPGRRSRSPTPRAWWAPTRPARRRSGSALPGSWSAWRAGSSASW